MFLWSERKISQTKGMLFCELQTPHHTYETILWDNEHVISRILKNDKLKNVTTLSSTEYVYFCFLLVIFQDVHVNLSKVNPNWLKEN